MATSESTETKSMITSLLTSTPLRCTVQQLCADFRNIIGYSIPYRKLGFSTAEEYLRSIPDTVQIIGYGPSAEVQGVISDKSAHINLMVAKQKTASIPIHKRKNLKSKNQFLNKNNQLANNLRGITHQTANLCLHEDEYVSRVPKRVQNNLRKLIMRFPDGITCTRLPHEYRKLFNEPLNYEKFKFRSLIEMCTDLEDIFHYIQQTTDDFILYEKNKAVPSLNQNEVHETEEETLGIDWSLGSDLIPSDVVQFLDEIPRFNLDEISVGDYLEINIGEIYDINRFWIFPKNGDLGHIEEKLQTRFHNERNRYVIPDLFLIEGLYCVVNYNKKYHRCVIVDTLPKNKSLVKVLFIDYGSVGEVNCKNIWYLPKEFYSQFPCQAVRARLSSVKPTDSQTTYKFQELITNSELFGEVIRIDKEELVLDLYLANVSSENNVFYINDALVEKGYADYF